MGYNFSSLAIKRRLALMINRYCCAVFTIAFALISCRSDRSSISPPLVASGSWVGWGKTVDDSGYAIQGTLNGRPLAFVVDYGANGFLLSDRMHDSLGIPHSYANASRVQVIIQKPGVVPHIDSTANLVRQNGDSIVEYWGDFEPQILDSLRIGQSLQQHLLLGAELSYASLHLDAGIGRDILSQFDIVFDGPGREVRLYQKTQTTVQDSTAHTPRWLPLGVAAKDCAPVAVSGPKPAPSFSPADTAGLSDTEKQKIPETLIAAQRMLGQIELKFPVVLEGHNFTANFDSGTRDAIMNSAPAKLLGFTSTNPRVQSAPDDSTPFVRDVDLRVGAHKLASPLVWIADAKFQGEPAYATTPMMLVGVAQFRNRVLFMSHSTGTICIGPAQ